MINIPILLLCWLSLIIPWIHASFIAPNLQASLPFRSAMATTVRNGSMLLFGGKGSGPPYQNDLFELTQHEKTYAWRRIPHANQAAPQGVMYSRSIYDERTDALLVFGGSIMAATPGTSPLQVYRYEFRTRQWETLMNSTINLRGQPWPDNRFHFDMAYDPSQHIAYLAGGHINGSYVASDMWSIAIDGRNLTFTRLQDMPAPRHGHTMSFISGVNNSSVESSRAIVFIGGIIQNNGQGPQLASMGTLDVYDTVQDKWITASITSGGSPGRANHVAAVDESQKIYIFGGDNGAVAEYDMMFFDDLRVLDPSTWEWDAPSPQGVPPGRRSYASAAILDGQYMTIAFGSTLNVWYNDINAFSLEDQNWHQSFGRDDTFSDNNTGLPPASIAGIVVGAVVGVALLLALFFLRRILWDMVQQIVWKQRQGEPGWTEVSRIASLTFLMILFCVLLGFMLRQVFTSPTVMQRYTDPSNFVDVPDIRFCFDGFPTSGRGAPGDPRLACQTDMGYDCNSDVISLDLTYFQPTSTTGFSTCFLYRPSLDFKLSPRTVGNKGSRLVFTIFANGSYASSGRIHISAYPRLRDPNVRLYNLTGVTAMSKAEIADWITNEQYNIQTSNTYTMQLLSYNGMGFNVVNRQSLVPDAWSYFGVLPHINHQRIVETTFQQNPPDTGYTSSHSDIGYLNVIPMDYANVRDREVRVYTLLNALGFVGGVASLFFTFHSWLWGARPNSPWGIVQRYASGHAQRSLRNNLRARFFDLAPSDNSEQRPQQQAKPTTYSNIPFVNEDAAFSYSSPYDSDIKEANEGRMQFMEDRLRLLERVVKSYYFDTEVFQQLNTAVNPTTAPKSNIRAVTSSSRLFRIPGINRRQRKQDEEQQRNEQHVLTAVPSSSSSEEEYVSNKNYHTHVE